MKVQGLGHMLHQMNAKQNSQLKSRQALPAKDTSRSDSYAQSVLPSPDDREKLLQAIKSKVKSGFYSSNAVAEDLSHGFAKILDESV